MSEVQSGSGSGPDAPSQDDPAALVEDINRTRAELGDTVEALVAKVDVKAQARQRAAEVSNQAKEKIRGMKQQLADRAGQLTGTAQQTRQAAAANGKTVLGAGAAGGQKVQQGAQRAIRTVSQHRVPVAAVAAGAGVLMLAGWLVVRRRRH